MDNVFDMVTNFIGKMTGLFVALLSFGVLAEIVFGGPVMGLSVITNIMNVISMLGDNGVVGLIALVILYHLFDKKS